MNIEKQVVSLELAKKLKELGVEKESEFVWYEANHSILKSDIGKMFWNLSHKYNNSARNSPRISAYNVAELGEMLKEITEKIDCGDSCYDLTFQSVFPTIGWSGNNHQEVAETEADTRAKMLIYLLENNLI